ncbi:AAA family ATPase [Desulfoluna spongiiphila]|uniref:AAA family ATPase n=1 Tax=Desulfoluna spongiiphila TaxID=419481 RepID=UPI00125FBF22|nr:AAA family ATPase [Desulfoluna spongiiphila]
MVFKLVQRGVSYPDKGNSQVYLGVDHWNDYSFVTMFHVSVHDENGEFHSIGNVKIGFMGQCEDKSTYSILPETFSLLKDGFFSLGVELEYYQNIRKLLSKEFGNQILSGLKDVAFDSDIFDMAHPERVFGTSLLRDVSLSVIKGQYKRIIDGGVPLTNFKFEYRRPQDEKFAGIEIGFNVIAESKPSTNIHAVIGRNGVGKTTLLNGMIEGVIDKDNYKDRFYDLEDWQKGPIDEDYFSRLVSVSFSAFDPFDPPPEQDNPALGTCYYYIGLKGEIYEEGLSTLKTLPDLQEEFCQSLSICFSQEGKRSRWIRAIKLLESDDNFAAMNLCSLANFSKDDLKRNALSLMERMSSGHAVVLLTTTKLVVSVEEKTLVLIDEPESHLHPPLLSAFVRALSELLYSRNGVAIIATHSPVVLQEIPASCVWKLTRSRLALSCSRPDIQTFGENVGVLTREVFGLEVVRSGFHKLLEESVAKGGTFEEIIAEYHQQLGFEAQAILRAMIIHRDGVGVK